MINMSDMNKEDVFLILIPILCVYDTENVYVFLTALGLPAGGSSTVHIYTQTIHKTTQ